MSTNIEIDWNYLIPFIGLIFIYFYFHFDKKLESLKKNNSERLKTYKTKMLANSYVDKAIDLFNKLKREEDSIHNQFPNENKEYYQDQLINELSSLEYYHIYFSPLSESFREYYTTRKLKSNSELFCKRTSQMSLLNMPIFLSLFGYIITENYTIFCIWICINSIIFTLFFYYLVNYWLSDEKFDKEINRVCET